MTNKIPKPNGDKAPLKRNIFWHLRDSLAALTPMFPYLGPGDIVPTGAVFRSDGMDHGVFHHENVCDELALVWGSNSTRMRTGHVHVGAKEHNVAGPSAENPDEYLAFCITQRQKDEGDQREALAYHCTECHNKLFELVFMASEIGEKAKLVPMLPTICGSAEWSSEIRGGEESRTCSKCGHVNEPFPNELWGWAEYVRRTEIVETAKLDLLEANK